MKILALADVRASLDDASDLFLLDVQPWDAHLAGHIPGSYGVPLAAPGFVLRVRGLVPDAATPLVIYDDGSGPSAQDAARRLGCGGYRDVAVFPGGLRAWRAAGLPLSAGALAYD